MSADSPRAAPGPIYICGVEAMPRHVRSLSPSHLMSLMTPDHMPETPAGIHLARHLKVACHDIVEPCADAILPGEQHLLSIIEFARGWDSGAMLIHCFAGVSRSTAAALTVAAVRHPGREPELARRLRAAAPHAHPNRRIVALADELLGRRGELVRAVEAMGWADMDAPRDLVHFTL